MKLFTLLHLALKYLLRYRRRYLFLFLALTFGFGTVTLITSLKDGMYENVYNSAQSHYAGDIIAIGYDRYYRKLNYLKREDMAGIRKAVENTNLKPGHSVMRTLFGDNGLLYYNGTAIRLKYVIGVDWDNEETYFNNLRYQERLDVFEESDTVLISAPVAEKLDARVGDRLVLEVETLDGQKNTGPFIVGGIVEDSTLFGYYKIYVSRAALNRLVLFEEDECSIMGFYFSDRRNVEKKRAVLWNELKKHAQTGPLVHDREELTYATFYRPWYGVKIFLLTIPVYLSEVADLLDAMNILIYCLYGMMVLIILMSAAVTFRIILHERRRELGTMRAIGFYEADLRRILVMETLELGVLSLVSGFIFAQVVSRLVALAPLSWFPSFEIFMKDGKLIPLYLFKTMVFNSISIFCVLIAAVWFPAFRTSRNPLPQMLNGGNTDA